MATQFWLRREEEDKYTLFQIEKGIQCTLARDLCPEGVEKILRDKLKVGETRELESIQMTLKSQAVQWLWVHWKDFKFELHIGNELTPTQRIDTLPDGSLNGKVPNMHPGDWIKVHRNDWVHAEYKDTPPSDDLPF